MSKLTFPALCAAVCACIVFFAAVCLPTTASAHVDRKLEGAQLFAARGCTHCHGTNGEGTDKAPSLRDVRKRMKAAQVAHQIKDGGQQMPAFGDTLDAEQIQSLVTFLRAKTWTNLPAGAAPAQTQ